MQKQPVARPDSYGDGKLGKVSKGVWRMPRLTEATKDVISCDKPRLAANTLLPGDFRMGQPSAGNTALLLPEHIGKVERHPLK